MYEIKPTFDRSHVQVDLPTCMYSVKTYADFEVPQTQLGAPITNGLNGVTSNENDLAGLQKRQAEIIKQLEQLRLKLNEMQTKLGVSGQPAKVSAKVTQKKSEPVTILPIDEKLLHDIVIHVNPSFVPYSLLGLQVLWTNHLNLIIECYTHSSIKTLPAQCQGFAAKVSSFVPNASVPTLKVSLIWKETNSTDLVCAPGTFIPISGEANILRYLTRIGPSESGYAQTIPAILELHALFDLTHELLLTAANDRSSVLKRLSQRLNTQTAFGGDRTNVNDIAVFSALKQLQVSEKELPENVRTWFKRNKTLIKV